MDLRRSVHRTSSYALTTAAILVSCLILRQRFKQQELQKENTRLRKEIEVLKSKAVCQSSSPAAPSASPAKLPSSTSLPTTSPSAWSVLPLSAPQICRYARQMLVPELGARAQQKFLSSAVLVIGAGGLGSPCLLYLAGAGVGRLGIVDYDRVEESNLHRQIMHADDQCGAPKVESAYQAIKRINPNVKVDRHACRITEDNAVELAQGYDVLIDCSDNLSTRYIVNYAAVRCGLPLVSGAAIGWEGQVSVYNQQSDDESPCYQCVYPRPMPREDTGSCADNGVLGPVCGIVGCLQALQALLVLARLEKVASVWSSKLCIYSGLSGRMLVATLPQRRTDCACCSLKKPLPELALLWKDEPCCNMSALKSRHGLHQEDEISVESFARLRQKLLPEATMSSGSTLGRACKCRDALQPPEAETPEIRRGCEEKDCAMAVLTLDVRSEVQYAICALSASVNIPYAQLVATAPEQKESIKKQKEGSSQNYHQQDTEQDLGSAYAKVCSEVPRQARKRPNLGGALCTLQARYRFSSCDFAVTEAEGEVGSTHKQVMPTLPVRFKFGLCQVQLRIRNVGGGLAAWSEKIDSSFPLY
eukprot:g73143.t1